MQKGVKTIEKKVTIYTLAEELGMTPSMVSRALNPNGKVNEEKRQRVLKAAKKYNFMPNRMASRLSMRTIKIGVIINSQFKPITDDMKAGIEAAYHELKDYKIEYELVETNNDFTAIENAIKRFNPFDGIIVSGLSSNRYIKLFKKIKNKNLVQMQNTNEDVDYLFSTGYDMALASDISAEFLSKCLFFSKNKNIALLTGSMESSVHKHAKEAFLKSAGENGLNIVKCIDMNDTEEMLIKKLPEVFSDDEINGVYITSGVSLSLCEYVKSHKINIPIVTFDVYKELNEYIKDNTVSATVFQNAKAQAKTAFERLAYYIINNEVPQKNIYTSVQLVMKSNLRLYE